MPELPEVETLVRRLRENATRFRAMLVDAGFAPIPGDAAIIPIVPTESSVKTGPPVMSTRCLGPGADPSAVLFDSLQAAKARKVDYVIVDTAGRLHTKDNLMAELEKIRKEV